MIKALLMSTVSTIATLLLYGLTDRLIFKYLSYICAVAFAICEVLCGIKYGMAIGVMR